MQTYTVQRGDTLFGISKQFGVSVDKIKKENNLSNTSITVGQVLKIPTKESTFTYIVQKGDTLYSISQKYGIPIENIMRTNNLTNTNLSVGQTLFLSVGGEDTSYSIYNVRPGDNLYAIAKKFNTTVNEIKSLNNLSSNLLQIGQELKVPNTQSNNFYIVQKGDTLYSIAASTGVSVDDLIKYNSLNNTIINIGQVLSLRPLNQSETTPDSSSGISNIALGSTCYGSGYVAPTYVTHTVVRGDNLYSIAARYGVSVDSIKKLNNLETNLLNIGQVLKIKEVN